MALSSKEIGQRIRGVRESLGIPLSAIASACGTDLTTIEQLEGGILEPVPGDFILIASRLLKTDFRYFISNVLDDVEAETRKVFRALSTPSSADLMAIKRFMHSCMSERELEQLLNVERPSLPPRYPLSADSRSLHKDQGKHAAVLERQRLLLGNQPIPNLFDLLRRQGIRLCRHTLEDARLSGVTVSHPIAGVCVLVNHDEDLYRQFFSTAHEYGHVLFDRDEVTGKGCVVSYRFSKKELIEIRANAFAAEFLLPSAAMTRFERPRSINEVKDLIAAIAVDYRVNAETVAIRMKEVGWISERTLNSFKEVKPVVIQRRDKRDPEVPLNLTDAQQTRFETALQNGVNSYFIELLRRGLTEERISFGRFAEMLDMRVEDAHEFVNTLGMAL